MKSMYNHFYSTFRVSLNTFYGFFFHDNTNVNLVLYVNSKRLTDNNKNINIVNPRLSAIYVTIINSKFSE